MTPAEHRASLCALLIVSTTPALAQTVAGQNKPVGTISGGMVPLPEPASPVTPDFIRGLCYWAETMNHFQPLPEDITLSVIIGARTINCPKDGKP
jgi:hypothetical protein